MINRELVRLKVVQLMYAYYQNEGKGKDVISKELDYSLAKAHDLYLYLLNQLIDLHDYATRKKSSEEVKAVRLNQDVEKALTPAAVVLSKNKFLLQLTENETLLKFRSKKTDWDEEPAFIKALFEQVAANDIFAAYIETGDDSYEADRELVRFLYKNVIQNYEPYETLLEEHSLYWNDDKHVIDSFVIKTIKRFEEKNGAAQELLPQYANNDDKVFAETLFFSAIDRADEVRGYIRDNVKNWKFERLALMDVLIMQLALTEMLCFESIPLRVSLSEYLDLAKIYSTPRSAGYINGLIDPIIQKLQTEGKLMKFI